MKTLIKIIVSLFMASLFFSVMCVFIHRLNSIGAITEAGYVDDWSVMVLLMFTMIVFGIVDVAFIIYTCDWLDNNIYPDSESE